jgi:molybdate transport repressor ModE-like protein
MTIEPKARSGWADRIGRRIKLRDLHILMAVEQTGSIAKAAQRLAISQPVVSKVIADLEQKLGARLLERDRHGAEPTVYGRALLKRAIAAFDELRQGVKDVEDLLDPTAGELRIAASDPMAAGLIPAIITRLSSRYPNATLYLSAGASLLQQQLAALRARQIDVIVGRLPQAISDQDVQVHSLCEEPILVAAGKHNPLVRRRCIKLAELLDEPWVLPDIDSFVGTIVADLFRRSGLPLPRRKIFGTSIQLNNALLATGNYVAIYPGSVVRLSGERMGIKVLNVDLPFSSTPLGIITLKGRALTPVVQHFIACSCEIAQRFDQPDPRGVRRNRSGRVA